MSSEKPTNPDKKETAPDLRTQVQSEEAVAASVELSIPQHVRQHAEAPKAEGYVLTKLLGQGAYGQVWRAWQIRTRKEVAVKVFMQRTGLDWIFLQREVERLSRLDRHPHIVSLLDMGLDEEPPYYVMDCIDGGALQKYVDPDAHVDSSLAKTLMAQVCDALAYVHAKGLIHCDLKPANILIDGRDHVRVVDFGLSRVFTESSATIGTLFFMAPEQAHLSEPGSPVQPDVQWDIYALGSTIYAILTGRVPYASPANIQSLDEAPNLADRLKRYRAIVDTSEPLDWNISRGNAIDPELIAIVEKCMALDTDCRYTSVSEIEQDLRAMSQRRPISPLAGSVAYRSKKFLQRNPLKVLLVLAGIALGAALVTGSVRQTRLDRAEAAELVAQFVNDPVGAVSRVDQSSPRVRRFVTALADRYVASSAFTDRVMGVRAALNSDRNAFWKSVSGGPLWKNGEWLELIDAVKALPPESEARTSLLQDLKSKLLAGSAHEKYVSLCLLGHLAPPQTELAERCAALVSSDAHPGVVAAAIWASKRLGHTIDIVSNGPLFVDELTSLGFVPIPPTDSFRRGSDASDPFRWPDEDRPAQGTAIQSIHMATTETTLAAFSAFFGEHASLFPPLQNALHVVTAGYVRLSEYPQSEQSKLAKARPVTGVSHAIAERYCKWLNEKAAKMSPKRTYRLPTEEEWEYAARSGSTSRFCFGANAKYARYFAHCNGTFGTEPLSASRMPNFYGLFDMHGGVWEHTSSIYPPEFADEENRNETLFVMRGGAWYSPAVRCRSSQRNYFLSGPREDKRAVGFRLVLELGP